MPFEGNEPLFVYEETCRRRFNATRASFRFTTRATAPADAHQAWGTSKPMNAVACAWLKASCRPPCRRKLTMSARRIMKSDTTTNTALKPESDGGKPQRRRPPSPP